MYDLIMKDNSAVLSRVVIVLIFLAVTLIIPVLALTILLFMP